MGARCSAPGLVGSNRRAPWFEATEEPCHDSHTASWDPRNPSPVEDSGRSLGGCGGPARGGVRLADRRSPPNPATSAAGCRSARRCPTPAHSPRTLSAAVRAGATTCNRWLTHTIRLRPRLHPRHPLGRSVDAGRAGRGGAAGGGCDRGVERQSGAVWLRACIAAGLLTAATAGPTVFPSAASVRRRRPRTRARRLLQPTGSTAAPRSRPTSRPVTGLRLDTSAANRHCCGIRP